MIRRLLSLFLAFVTILSLLPTAAFAASSEEDALGEVDIYNGDYELGYLAINGTVRKQKYTYFLYESNDGSTKESPAYCVNPNQYGVPQTVGPGESIKYLAEEKASDPKVVGIISNGYPHRSLGELGLENKYQAFYATKMALWYYLIPSWDISNLKVAPGLSGDELDRGNRILAAAKDIYKRGTTYNYTVDLGYAGSNTRRGRVGHDIAHTLETSCIQGIVERGGRIRRLMPRESLRLQGFAEEQIDKILAFTSDAQAYKQAGNSVTVTVIEAIGRRILAVDEEPRKMGDAA